jgi:hypothetical protein
MNKFKANARILLVIIVSAFIVIPIAAVLLSKVLGVHEGMEDYDMSDKNVKMDVAKINLDGKNYFGYCLGGDIKCKSDKYTLAEARGYTDKNGKTHKIYEATCECPDDVKRTDDQGNLVCPTDALVKCDGRNVKKIIEDTGISLTHKEYDNTTNLITMSDNNPETFLPWDISTNGYVYLYNNQGNIDASFSACHLYGDCPDEENEEDKDKEKSKKSKMKCLADNGAKPGDPLCCGQDGVLQDTKYNCPSEYPHCIGYKCGETWGKCSTTEE